MTKVIGDGITNAGLQESSGRVLIRPLELLCSQDTRFPHLRARLCSKPLSDHAQLFCAVASFRFASCSRARAG